MEAAHGSSLMSTISRAMTTTIRSLSLPLFILTIFVLASTVRSVRAEPTSGNVTVSVGDVKVTSADGAESALAAGDKVATGSTVKTGAGARAVIVMTPRSAIRIGENSEVLIEEVEESATPPKVTVDVKNGSLGALLKPGTGAEMDFKIKTPSGIAAARGTYYAVVVEDGKGFAQVKEGRVEIVPAKPADEAKPN